VAFGRDVLKQPKRRCEVERRTVIRKISLAFLSIIILSFNPFSLVSAGSNEWTSLGPEGGRIFTLAIDLSTPTTVYAGTLYGGVYKSNDGGESWEQKTNGLGQQIVYTIAINPISSQTLYVGTEENGVFKSVDRG